LFYHADPRPEFQEEEGGRLSAYGSDMPFRGCAGALLFAVNRNGQTDVKEEQMSQQDICKMTILCLGNTHTRRKVTEVFSVKYSGHELLLAENGQQALTQIKQSNPDIYIIGIDTPAPEFGAVTDEIIRLGKEEQSIVMLESENGQILEKYRQSGTKYFLKKPIPPDRLLGVLEKITESVFLSRWQRQRA
jgi:CheY-like chemotaxis protein